MNILTDKPKRTAGNAWLERVNPLHDLTIAQARNIFDVARAHGSPLLQKIYDEIELVDPVLGVCVDRRQAALAELGWKISPRPSADQGLADEQKDALDRFVRGIGNFTEMVEHLDLAFFRGFSVVQPIWEGDQVRHVSLLESWNFLFDYDRRLLWNPDCSLDPRACFEIPAAARIVQVRRRRPIDYPALAIHIRKYLGERDWGRFIERYGIPPVDVVMAPNATNENKADYVEAADRARDGLSTVWPSGSSTSRAEGSRGQDPFSAFIEHQEKLIVLRATGGTLTSLAQSDTGSLAGGAQMEVWHQIVQRDSSLISDALNRQMFWLFLERNFPGRAPAVEFSIGREREVTASDAADLAVKLHGAGYLVDQAELEEATGFTLEKAPETPSQDGLDGLSLNKKPETPFKNDENGFKNAPRNPDGQGEGSPEDALVEALSGLFEKSLAEAAAEGVRSQGSGVSDGEAESRLSHPSQKSHPSQDEIANSVDANGAEHGEHDGKFVGKGEGGEAHTPEQKKRIEEYQTAVDDKALAWRDKVLALDEESQKKEFFQFGTSDKRMAADLKAKTGIDTDGWPVKMQGNHAVHIEQRHGASGTADRSMSDPKDFARIGYALKNYDSVELLPDNQGYRSKNNGPAKQVEFRTRIDGTMAVQTVVPDTKRKTLFITSTRIEKRKDGHL